METSRQQEHQLRRMGREAVTKAIQAANANSDGMRRVTAKVTRVNSDYTVDVDMGDSAYSMPITGLRYTTSCFGVRVGDTVLVDVVGHLATVTGILATADNGPYVLRGTYRVGTIEAKAEAWTHIPVSFPTSDYTVSVTCSSPVPYWTWVSLVVDDFRPDRFSLRWCNDASVNVNNYVIGWVAVWMP